MGMQLLATQVVLGRIARFRDQGSLRWPPLDRLQGIGSRLAVQHHRVFMQMLVSVLILANPDIASIVFKLVCCLQYHTRL